MIYTTPDTEEPLSQGDILDDCPVFGLEVSSSGVDLDGAPARWQMSTDFQSCIRNDAPQPFFLFADSRGLRPANVSRGRRDPGRHCQCCSQGIRTADSRPAEIR